jgi:hypothetical protein
MREARGHERSDMLGAAERHGRHGGGGWVIAMAGVDHLYACNLVIGQGNQPKREDNRIVAKREHTPRPRKPSLRKLIAQAEKAGKTVSGLTTPDGHTLTFGEPQSREANNPWLVDLDRGD